MTYGYLINTADGSTIANLRGVDAIKAAVAAIKPGQRIEVTNGMGDDTDIIIEKV